MARLTDISSSGGQTPSTFTEDRISSLPWHILDIILCYLPILDAVRTSVLSKDWRYKWLSISMFVLDSNALSLGRKTREHKWNIVASLINKYLRHHTGPIKKFELRTNLTSHEPEMYQWIQFLTMQNVEVLSLQENSVVGFEMPSYLFSFKKLDKLFIAGCFVKVPSDVGVFTSVRTLNLRYVEVETDVNHLILCCPMLEKLTLLNMFGVKLLRISSQRLNALLVDTSVEDIVVEAAPCLANVAVIDALRISEDNMLYNSLGVIRTLFGLVSLKDLALSGDIIKFLSVTFGVGAFPWRNYTVTSLTFRGLIFETVDVFEVCLNLLNACANVQHFYFTFRSAKGPQLVSKFLTQIQGKYSFPELKTLKMLCPAGVGMGCTVNLLLYISTHSPNLKALTVVKQGADDMNQTRIARMLTRLRKPCPQASVRYVNVG